MRQITLKCRETFQSQKMLFKASLHAIDNWKGCLKRPFLAFGALISDGESILCCLECSKYYIAHNFVKDTSSMETGVMQDPYRQRDETFKCMERRCSFGTFCSSPWRHHTSVNYFWDPMYILYELFCLIYRPLLSIVVVSSKNQRDNKSTVICNEEQV